MLRSQLDKFQKVCFSKGHLSNLNFKVFFIANFLTQQDGELKFGLLALSDYTRQNQKNHLSEP